ncbi:hypothetical protein [uncultured Phocaeicola sp.]|uniref:hypothetical protein n=1 Tax=uncultured Phocaeicola sp. TaxID=990718 RepID=UPI0030C710B0
MEERILFFLRKDLYDDWFHNDGLGYVVELLSLIDTLIKKKYIIMIPFCTDNILMVGADACWLRPEVMSVNGNQLVTLTYRNENWLDSFGNSYIGLVNILSRNFRLEIYSIVPFL